MYCICIFVLCFFLVLLNVFFRVLYLVCVCAFFLSVFRVRWCVDVNLVRPAISFYLFVFYLVIFRFNAAFSVQCDFVMVPLVVSFIYTRALHLPSIPPWNWDWRKIGGRQIKRLLLRTLMALKQYHFHSFFSSASSFPAVSVIMTIIIVIDKVSATHLAACVRFSDPCNYIDMILL